MEVMLPEHMGKEFKQPSS